MKWIKSAKLRLSGIFSIGLLGYATAVTLTINVNNNSPSVAHIDYSSPEFTITPAPIDGNLPYYSTASFDASNANIYGMSVQIGQYSASSLLGVTPLCYYNFSYNSNSKTWTAAAQTNTTTTYCSITGSGSTFKLTLSWPAVAAVNYNAVTANAFQVVGNFLKSQQNYSYYMVPNQAPLSQAQLDNFTTATEASSSNGWTLQFAYDSIRLPLWLGADYQTETSNSSFRQYEQKYLNGLTNYISSHTCTNSNGNMSVGSSGFWAYTITGVSTVGSPVSSACGSTPALEGPLAMAAQAVSNNKLLESFVTTLNSYNIASNTFSAFESINGNTLSQSTYTSSSSPYFNATLDLISQALLIGKGSFDISSTNSTGSSTDYLNYSKFLSNYQAWLNDGFVVSFGAPDPANGENIEPSLRVLYSTYNGITYTANESANTTGNSPTVSEGMGYGLLISYAANDQATFDKFLWYILSEGYYQGCARLSGSNTISCGVKSQYLMPWMVDETGSPFNYAVGGGYYTSGSATDADIQILWAVYLASQRVSSGIWSNHTFDNLTYLQIAQAMADEINRYEINTGVDYYGSILPYGGGVIFSPGSQWGTPIEPTSSTGSVSGTDMIYPGYITPQAFVALQSVQNGGSNSLSATKSKQQKK